MVGRENTTAPCDGAKQTRTLTPACKSPTINRVGLHGARTEVPERPRLPIVGPCYWHGRGTGSSYSPCRGRLLVPKPRGYPAPRVELSLDVLEGSGCVRVNPRRCAPGVTQLVTQAGPLSTGGQRLRSFLA